MNGINQKTGSIKQRIIGRLASYAAIFTILFIAVLFFFDVVADGLVGQILERLLTYEAARAVIDNRDILIWIVYLGGVLIIVGLSHLHMAEQFDAVSRVMEGLLDQRAPSMALDTELRTVEDALRRIRATVERKEMLAREAEQRKNDLVVYLAHDLKTPLTSVIGYLSMLQETPDLPPEQRIKYVDVVLDKALRLEQLINEFFDITRFNLQSVELMCAPVDLSLLLAQLVDEFQPILAAKNLAVEMHAAAGLTVVGDADKLARVFDNLLRNAAAYSDQDTVLKLSAEQQEGEVRISLKNRGPQIPPEMLGRIFEKFFRLDAARASSTGGAGLGLAIAKQLVELHGGSIKAVSNADNTEFSVFLPVGGGGGGAVARIPSAEIATK